MTSSSRETRNTHAKKFSLQLVFPLHNNRRKWTFPSITKINRPARIRVSMGYWWVNIQVLIDFTASQKGRMMMDGIPRERQLNIVKRVGRWNMSRTVTSSTPAGCGFLLHVNESTYIRRRKKTREMMSFLFWKEKKEGSADLSLSSCW